MIYVDDHEKFLQTFSKENVLKAIEEQGAFHSTYRLMLNGAPVYATLKAVRMSDDETHIIIGVNNVDAQMRQQEAIERLQEETITYSRISALMGNFIAIYTVDPETGAFMEYSATEEFERLQTSKAGTDFFEMSRREIERVIYPEDLAHFRAGFSKEKVMEATKNGGIYKLHYRLMINGEPVMMTLRAGMVMEKDQPELIVGLRQRTLEME